MQFIYLIGAQCTGKTTLSEALINHIKAHHPALNCQLLNETARKVLRVHGYSRDDINEGGSRCLDLQKLILESQYRVEQGARGQDYDVVISDRSGLDPLVYASVYCGDDSAEALVHSQAWKALEGHLHEGLVVICGPVASWLKDDGTRIMPHDMTEWNRTHQKYEELLKKYEIKHATLDASIQRLSDRVQYVWSLWEGSNS